MKKRRRRPKSFNSSTNYIIGKGTKKALMLYLICRSKRKVLPGNSTGSQDGNVSVTVALCMVLLVGIMAFTLDTGYMLAEKNHYQQAAEAAARAGALSLHGDDPVAEVRRIAIANGCPDSEALIVQLGFYDELDSYEDFSVYKDFEADPDPQTTTINEAVTKNSDGEYHYNNAVLVMVVEPTDGLTGGLSGTGMTVAAAAVTYLERHGIILGEDGLTYSSSNFVQGYPEFKDCTIHANGDLSFLGSETFSGDTRASATGGISGGPAAAFEGARSIEMEPLEDEMERLRHQADQEGTLYDASTMTTGSTEWRDDAPFGQYYRPGPSGALFIRLAATDHNGAVYFFTSEGSSSVSSLLVLTTHSFTPTPETLPPALNFTLATDLPMEVVNHNAPVPMFHQVLGEEGGAPVAFYSSRYIWFRPVDNRRREFICKGVLFRAAEFRYSLRPLTTGTYGPDKIRIITDAIDFTLNQPGSFTTIDSTFGPPGPPFRPRMGTLLRTGG